MPRSAAAAKSVQRAVDNFRLRPDTTSEDILNRVRLKPDPTPDPLDDPGITTGIGTYVASGLKRTPCRGGRTSLYNHRKYASSTIARLNTSGIRKTPYTGSAAAPKNADVNSAAVAGGDSAARNAYAQTTASASSRTLKISMPLRP